MNNDFKSVMNSVTNMNSVEFTKTLEEERKKMLSLKKQFPNNPLFSQMDSGDFDISQEEFVDMCKLILTGNMSETLTNAFNFMQENNDSNTDDINNDVEGDILSSHDNKSQSVEDDNESNDIEG
jgi:hypothetical protein